MQISGLVITTQNVEMLPALKLRLQDMPSVTVGETNENKLAVVIESTGQSTSKKTVYMLEEFPEVLHVDVVFVHFDDEEKVDEVDPINLNTVVER